MTAPKPARKKIVLDLFQIYARCIEEGECMLWRQGANDNGVPYAQHNGKTQNVRRLAWALQHGMPVRDGYRVFPICGNSACLSAEHLRAKTPSELAAHSVSLGRYVSPLADARKRAARQAQSKLTMADARSIRTDSRPVREIAKHYGMSYQQMVLIRQGKSWNEPAANPFSGLLR